MTDGAGLIPPEGWRTTRRPFDDEHAPLYTVGQVADMLGVQPAFLRRLDTEAVVRPARSDGGQRRYTRLEILMVEKVVGLADEGLTLAGIRRLLVLEDRVRDLQRQLKEQRGEVAPAEEAERD
ncbi:MAG: MerR family transcriptional regulator [Actinomycetota bacterium]|nr:MerR family transcriptional regulator [Actinomycetota bacterium]